MKAFKKTWSRSVVLSLTGGLALLVGCDSLLEVDNPARIDPEDLRNEQLIEVLTSSVPSQLHGLYDDRVVWRASMLTDETVTGINWEQTARLNERVIRFDEDDAEDMFGELQQYRMVSDSVAALLGELLEEPNSSWELAQTLAYSGYSFVFMGDILCETVFDLGDTIYQTNEIYGLAIPKFEEAIQIANAADREDIANLARVGLARAYLNMGQPAEAMAAAAQVPEDFEWWVHYGDNALNTEINDLYTRTTGNNHALGVHAAFLNGTHGDTIVDGQTDPRVQHFEAWRYGHNGSTELYTPYAGIRFSNYNGETIADGGSPGEFLETTDIQLASGLEAWHHYYEAAGPGATGGPAGSTLDFVNARRAIGNQSPVNLSDDELMAELRQQRGRDLFLGGFRLGDLRRWDRQGVGDFFPTGDHPARSGWRYQDAKCFPIPLEEYESNPNIANPNRG